MTTVSINNADFLACINRYVDENDVDQLQKRQMNAWKLEWKETEMTQLPQHEANDDDVNDETPSHVLSGTLSWNGDYLAAILNVSCSWRQEEKTKADESSPSSFLQIVCNVSIEELPLAHVSSEEGTDRKQSKIHSKMIRRLRKDDYISKLLGAKPKELFRASIRVDPTSKQFQERVDYDFDKAEAIRRAVFSSAEAPIDVLDLVCRFPYLPGTYHTTMPTTTSLADRAMLRLLEDATYDACENEGEEEIVEDLSLKDEEEQTPKAKRSKKCT